MPDTPLTALDPRQQKLLANAQRALEKNNLDYVQAVCGEILRDQPGCLSVRRLHYTAQLKATPSSGWMGKALGGLASLPFSLGGKGKSHQEALARVEKMLASDPRNVAALKLLAAAAQGFDWPETVAFAYESIRGIEPRNRENLLALGEAWLAAGKPEEALQVADGLLRQNSVDGDAQSLMRKASIARTTTQGQWEGTGNYREKLKDEAESVALERGARQAEDSPNLPVEVTAVADLDEASPRSELDTARALVERYPGDLDARFQFAELLLAASEIELAIAEYQQTRNTLKWRVPSLLGLARCFRARGLIDLAITQLRTAKNELSLMDKTKKAVIYELGTCHEALQQPDQAIEQFKEIYTEDIGFRDVAEKINAHYASSKGS